MKPFKCSACGKAFNSRGAVNHHIRDMRHEGAKWLPNEKKRPPIEDDESDIGAVFSALRLESQQLRADNREAAPVILADADLSFETNNAGVHLIVERRVDFWPGTGLWIDRVTKKRARGVMNLVRFLEREL